MAAFTRYAVMIQDDSDYKEPEMCFAAGTDDVGLYKSGEQAQEMIEYLVNEGFPRENYFIVKIAEL